MRPRHLILAATALWGCQRVPPPTTPTSPELFREIAESVGLRFQHVNGASGQYLMPEIMGAGAAVFDMDGDGDLDVLLVQSLSLIHI